MATAAGIVVVTGGLTLLNEALNAPYENGTTDVLSSINWRVIPATVVAALMVSGLSAVNETAAKMVAGIGLVAVLFTRLGNGPSPVEHLVAVMGYGPQVNAGGHGVRAQ